MKHSILLLFIHACLAIQLSFGQEVSHLTLPVKVDGKTLLNPFAGGLTAPQFSNMDLNQDGNMDLVVFDRTGDVIVPFVYEAGQLVYAPEYAASFPRATQWMLLRDFDGDGVGDVFMSPTRIAAAGIEVRRGIFTNGELSFEVASVNESDTTDILQIPLRGDTRTQVYNSLIDLPEIKDIDGDGDLDIFSFEVAGSTINYYKNESIERTGIAGLDFELGDNCFGLIVEAGLSERITLSTDGVSCGESMIDAPAELRHAGSTVTLHDLNQDGLLDALIGDVSNDGLVFLENGGDESRTWFTTQDLEFPDPQEPVKINIFNAAFFIDIDNDSIEELIVAPNEVSGLQTTNHIWHYEPSQTDSGTALELANQNFLVDEMLYFGKDASPIFIDFNGDELMDILVGSAGRTDFDVVKHPALYLLKNVGTITEPAFELFDEDFINFSRFNTTSTHFFPAAGDLDGDGDVDLLIGDDRGFLYYVENIAQDKTARTFAEPIYQYQDLNPGQFLKPAIYDFNGDGLMDIVAGERNHNTVDGESRSLNYFENRGDVGNPVFSDTDDSFTAGFGAVNTTGDPGFFRNFSAPAVAVTEGRTILFVGTRSGRIRLYDDIDGNSDGVFTEVTTEFGNIREGNHSTPALFDLNNDGFFEMLVGNRRGGLGLYTTDIVSDIRSSTEEIEQVHQFAVTPNPATDFITIQSPLGKPDRIELINVSGQVVLSTRQTKINTQQLNSGSYFVKIYAENKVEIHKIVVNH